MEYSSKDHNNVSAADSVSLIVVLLLLTTLNCIIILKDLYSNFCQLSKPFFNLFFYLWRVWAELAKSLRIERKFNQNQELETGTKKRETGTKKSISPHQKINVLDYSEKLNIGEVTIVMGKLQGTCYDPDGDKLQDRLGSNDINALFEAEEPSLEEVNEAFSMFDENNDGFIDAKELRKVLCTLCFAETSEADCTRMIRAYDDNGDGVIDFDEFVRLMANSFS